MAVKRIFWVAAALFSCGISPSLAQRIVVSVHENGDSVRIGIDTLTVQKVVEAAAKVQGLLSGGGSLAQVPPEAWQRMTPEQVQELVNTALLKVNRGGIFPDAGGKPWNRVEIVVPVVGTVASFAAVVLIVFFVVRYKQNRSRDVHEERLAMIEKGIDPTQFLTPPKPPRIQRMMIWGYILSFGGAGWTVMTLAEDGLSGIGIGPVLALAGVGLIFAGRYLERQKRERERELRSAEEA